MPLVIPRSGPVQYIRTEEILAEILGHENFDGENWAIGDRLIFEDGTESWIKQEPGEQFHVWDEPTPADFEQVKQAVGMASARDWQELFAAFEAQSKRKGCAASALVVALAMTAAALVAQ